MCVTIGRLRKMLQCRDLGNRRKNFDKNVLPQNF